jgi:pSer/pThr/pTyr-binding forkhead associated (FHA) protein
MIVIHLQGTGEEGHGREIVIDRFPFDFGRPHDCDYLLNNPCVSRRHCCFLLKGEDVWIQDLESTSGTYLNGTRIGVPQVLQDGDRIALDSFSFQVSLALVTR